MTAWLANEEPKTSPWLARAAAGASGGDMVAPESLKAAPFSLEGRHPDTIAEELMARPADSCTKEQLEFLYKTLRYAPLLPCPVAHAHRANSSEWPAALC